MPGGIKPVIGLEVHAQLLTRTKMFCACANTYGDPPNTHTCPVCLGLPGALPQPNRAAVEMAVRLGLAVGASIALRTKFDRKNYFYPDLPKGYQISQYDQPLCAGGSVVIRGASGSKTVGLVRIHLEEDAGKSLHDDPDGTLVDFNRCGVPLVEIVSQPDLESPQEAYAYLMQVRRLVRWLGVCDGNLEEGSLRCDANVSLTDDQGRRGTAVEIKNLNSFHAVERALQFEIDRQAQILSQGGCVARQTLLWDAAAGCTRPLRAKEGAEDYRYFPEPDLVELEVAPEWVEGLRRTMPELPDQCRTRLMESLDVRPAEADILTSDRDIARFFEELLACLGPGDWVRPAVKWVTGEALRWRKELGSGERFVVSPEATAEVVRLEISGRLSGLSAKTVYETLAKSSRSDPEAVMRELGLEQVSDHGELARLVDDVIRRHPAEVERFRSGETKLLGFLIGQAMKDSGGRADPKTVGEMLRNALK